MKLGDGSHRRGLAREDFDARMLLQIHDELIFEVRRSQLRGRAAGARRDGERRAIERSAHGNRQGRQKLVRRGKDG